MDLGSMVCTPRNPRCDVCPWQGACKALTSGCPEQFPRKAARKPKPMRQGYVFWLTDNHDQVYLRRRPEKGLLGGMVEFPSTAWQEDTLDSAEITAQAPTDGVVWELVEGTVTHTFTHFHLQLAVLQGRLKKADAVGNGYWCRPEDFHQLVLPTVMKKVAAHVAGSRKRDQSG